MANPLASPSIHPLQNPHLPSPAIVAQEAVRRLPRWSLFALSMAYIAFGFVGRDPWRFDDLAGFGLILQALSTWLAIEPTPTLWFITRLMAAATLALLCASTWYATYYLAKRKAAQPVPFAFGGEAHPADYACAIADGALLALIACLGLAQLGHETTPALLQATLVSLAFFAIATFQYHPIKAWLAGAIATLGLVLTWRQWSFDLTQWHSLLAWKSSLHMLIWFAWPAWVLALIAITKWRKYWLTPRPALHIAAPLGIVLIHVITLPLTGQQDRWFLGALSPLAALAAFALPTLSRGLKSLIDLFTLLFFSGCAIIIWVVWLAMQIGIPPQPAANVARLLPAFTPSFSMLAFIAAFIATAAWSGLVAWRVGRHRPAIWMSMVLPAGGAALCWILLTSLWLPLLNHARGYQPLMHRLVNIIQTAPPPALPAPSSSSSSSSASTPMSASCVHTHGLRAGQVAALHYYLRRPVLPASKVAQCPWLITTLDAAPSLPEYVAPANWEWQTTIRRPSDKNEEWLIYRKKP